LAIEIYKKIILEQINEDIEIDGMGNSEQSISYYEWFIYRWYSEGIKSGKYKGTAYDALSLCYLSLKSSDADMEEAMTWYQSMIDLYPDKYQFLYGYANILYSKGIF
jgi:tetratricopeptide (TPR) repeat protein